MDPWVLYRSLRWAVASSHPSSAPAQPRSTLTPPRRKQVTYVCGLLGAVAAGFASHWVIPAVVPPAAQAAPESIAEKRLLAVELQLAEVGRQVAEIGKGMIAVKCRLNIENTCPPEALK